MMKSIFKSCLVFFLILPLTAVFAAKIKTTSLKNTKPIPQIIKPQQPKAQKTSSWGPVIGVGGGIGTLGASLAGVISINSHFSVEASYNNGMFYQPNINSTIKGTKIIHTPKIQSFLAAANYYFAANGLFHVSGGVALNGLKDDLKVDAPATGTFVVNSTTYNMSDFGGSITGSTKMPVLAPYLGIGIGGNPNRADKSQHFFFDANLGVLYQGAAKATLKAANGSNAALMKVIEDNFNKDAEKHQFYPVVMINLYYYI